jgi:hypothetical protein
LLEEWEQLRDPSRVPTPVTEVAQPAREKRLSDDHKTFTVMLRNAVFQVVRRLASRDDQGVADLVVASNARQAWTGDQVATAMAPYFDTHDVLRTDVHARGARHTIIERQPETWRVRQILLDPDDDADWYLQFVIDLARSDEAGAPSLELEHIGC